MPPTPPLGSRVVLRFRRPAGSVPSQSDVIGILESLTPDVGVRTAAGELTTVAPAAVVVLKSIPPRPVRTAGIRRLEYAAAFADPTLECEWVAGWVARAGGDTLASSAVPLADPSMPEGGYFHDLLGEPTLRALADWYAARRLPLQLRLPDRLARPPASWQSFGERLILAADLAAPGADPLADGDRVLFGRAPDWPSEEPAWAGLVLGDGPGEPAPRIEALMGEAARLGAGRVYLEVPYGGGGVDTAARALGFGDHHRVRHVRLERSS